MMEKAEALAREQKLKQQDRARDRLAGCLHSSSFRLNLSHFLHRELTENSMNTPYVSHRSAHVKPRSGRVCKRLSPLVRFSAEPELCLLM
jgi:hypothetical protein